MPRWKNNGAFFTPIRLHRALKKSKRTVGSPTRTTKARLRGQRVIGELLLHFTELSGRHSVLERPLSEVNGRLFFS